MEVEIFECTYLPHGDFWLPEEEDVDLPRHLRRLLHVHVVVEEVLDRRDPTQRLQLLEVGFLLLASLGSGRRLGLWLQRGDAVQGLLLLQRVEGYLPLIVPELPVGLQWVGLLLEELSLRSSCCR